MTTVDWPAWFQEFCRLAPNPNVSPEYDQGWRDCLAAISVVMETVAR